MRCSVGSSLAHTRQAALYIKHCRLVGTGDCDDKPMGLTSNFLKLCENINSTLGWLRTRPRRLTEEISFSGSCWAASLPLSHQPLCHWFLQWSVCTALCVLALWLWHFDAARSQTETRREDRCVTATRRTWRTHVCARMRLLWHTVWYEAATDVKDVAV